MQKACATSAMSPAAIAGCWRQNCPRINAISSSHALIFFSRWLTELPATEAFDAQLIKRTSTSTDSMFGLSSRKRALQDNPEEDYLMGASFQADPPRSKTNTPESPEPSNNLEQENFFSKAWAAQKNLNHKPRQTAVEQQHRCRDEHSILRRKSGSTAEVSLSYDPRYRYHDRIWQYSADMPPFTQERFIIASYNILATTYACQRRRDLFAHVPGHLLNWKSRKRKILRELRLCSPDIICLQEVDRYIDLEQDLALKGYVGSYKVHNEGGPNGCAIFWRKERFKLLQEESLEFSELGMNNNVAQLCVLQSLVSGAVNNGSNLGFRIAGQRPSHSLIVGNICVLYNPKRGDIKLGQCRTFLEQAYSLSSSWPGAPVVIAGDFSSTPLSAVYDFLATSELEVSGLDRRYLSGQITKVSSSASKSQRHSGAREFGLETCLSNKALEAAGDEKETLLSSNTSTVGSKVSQNIRSEVSLKEKLQKILMPRFASNKGIHATEFANAAAEALGVYCNNNLDGLAVANSSVSSFHDDHCSTDGVNGLNKKKIRDEALKLGSDNVHKERNEELGENPLLSRTFEILESSLCSKATCGQASYSRSPTCEGGMENDVFADSSSQRIMVEAKIGNADELATHCMQSYPSELAFSCTPEAGSGGSTESKVPVLRSFNQDSILNSVQGDGFDTCADSSMPCKTFVELSTESQRINMEGKANLLAKSQPLSGIAEVDGANLSMPCNTMVGLAAQSHRINMEGNADLLGKSQASNDVGEVHVHHAGQREIQRYTTASSPCHQSMDYDNNQVNQMLGSAGQTNLGKTQITDIGKITPQKEIQFFDAKEQNGDLEMPNLVEEGSFRVKYPPCTLSDQHLLHDCRSLEQEDEGQAAILIGNSLEQYLNTHASITSEEASSTPELSSLSKFESSALQKDSYLKSSHRTNLRDIDSSISDCLSNVGNPVKISEEGKYDDNDIVSKHEWDLKDLKRATGDPDCTTVRHKLNLHSVYPEIQGRVGTRDAKGEPLITTYRRQFRGTVDYIWRTDGLKPTKVLDTVPLEAILFNKGLPSKVWGSYHLAIACELAFIHNQRELGHNKVEPGT